MNVGVLSILFMLLGAAAVAAIIGFIVMALIQVAREPRLPPVLRVCWVIVLVGFPIGGTLVWFGFGHDINRWILAGT
ncbi:hypothetical protein ACHABQ_08235 [Nesterenkonia aurantiaca]|uniref:hypothetical protein n=1 Tax=Nesterenkonia aurantiaca TaxID=1436010 RepID=UPI003EE43EF4